MTASGAPLTPRTSWPSTSAMPEASRRALSKLKRTAGSGQPGLAARHTAMSIGSASRVSWPVWASLASRASCRTRSSSASLASSPSRV